MSELLDPVRLLASGAIARVEYFETLDSTQDVASRLAREHAGPTPLLVATERQTAGRGRGANRWWTGHGSLAFSLLLDPADWSLPRVPLPERSLAVGVAIVETLHPLLPRRRVGLHWPNDVFVDDKKISGVLVDVLTDGQHVIGIGLNANNSFVGAPDEVRARATSLHDQTGSTVDRTALLIELLQNLKSCLQESVAAPEEFGRRFGELCLQLGHELTLESGGQVTSGICGGVAVDGAMILETRDGFQKFYSGVLRK